MFLILSRQEAAPAPGETHLHVGILDLYDLKDDNMLFPTPIKNNDSARLLPTLARFYCFLFCCFYPFFKRESSTSAAVAAIYLPPKSLNYISAFFRYWTDKFAAQNL